MRYTILLTLAALATTGLATQDSSYSGGNSASQWGSSSSDSSSSSYDSSSKGSSSWSSGSGSSSSGSSESSSCGSSSGCDSSSSKGSSGWSGSSSSSSSDCSGSSSSWSKGSGCSNSGSSKKNSTETTTTKSSHTTTAKEMGTTTLTQSVSKETTTAKSEKNSTKTETTQTTTKTHALTTTSLQSSAETTTIIVSHETASATAAEKTSTKTALTTTTQAGAAAVTTFAAPSFSSVKTNSSTSLVKSNGTATATAAAQFTGAASHLSPQSPLAAVGSSGDDELVYGNEYLDGISTGTLDHAPANSHGTYVGGIQDDVEDLENYQPGGYHPIHLGDRLGSPDEIYRYHVLHKLGHGGFSTVWLCRDTNEGKYVGIKVHTADVTTEDIPDLRLVDLDKSTPGAEYINIPKDHFSFQGPNGTHQCLVLALLGPPVSPSIWFRMDNPGPVLRSMCYQTVQALQFLHENGICHGDFRPANILLKLTNLDHVNEDQIVALLGEPEQSVVLTESGEDLPPSTPRYLVASIDLLRLGPEYLTEDICVIDFCESFLTSSPPTDRGIPENYLAPEIMIEDETSIGPGCDLWALGCTLFEIWRQMPLFYMINETDELLAEMVQLIGKFPESWWRKWEARGEFFTEDGRKLGVGGMEPEIYTLETFMNGKLEIEVGSDRAKKVLAVHEEEQKFCGDLLRKLFLYTPSLRLSAREAVEHDWFRM